MEAADRAFIEEAERFFENDSSFMKMFNMAGNVIEAGIAKLPAKIRDRALAATNKALQQCLKVAVWSTESKGSEQSLAEAAQKSKATTLYHSAASAATGAVSGFLGPEVLLLELPITTSVLMRSIAKTANEYGFDTNDPEVMMDCLFIFTLGGSTSADNDGMNSAYFSSRFMLKSLMREVAQASTRLSARELITSLERGAAPSFVKFVAVVSDRFGLRVAEKFVAQIAPIAGAVGGAAINVAFNQYFSQAAKYHFGMKRLEQKYSADAVKEIYDHRRDNRKVRSPT